MINWNLALTIFVGIFGAVIACYLVIMLLEFFGKFYRAVRRVWEKE